MSVVLDTIRWALALVGTGCDELVRIDQSVVVSVESLKQQSPCLAAACLRRQEYLAGYEVTVRRYFMAC